MSFEIKIEGIKQVGVQTMKEMLQAKIGELNPELIIEIIKKLTHEYVAFTNNDDLTEAVKKVCLNNNWDYKDTLAIYGEIGPKGFGPCLVAHNYDIEKFVCTIERYFRMRVFL